MITCLSDHITIQNTLISLFVIGTDGYATGMESSTDEPDSDKNDASYIMWSRIGASVAEKNSVVDSVDFVSPIDSGSLHLTSPLVVLAIQSQ